MSDYTKANFTDRDYSQCFQLVWHWAEKNIPSGKYMIHAHKDAGQICVTDTDGKFHDFKMDDLVDGRIVEVKE